MKNQDLRIKAIEVITKIQSLACRCMKLWRFQRSNDPLWRILLSLALPRLKWKERESLDRKFSDPMSEEIERLAFKEGGGAMNT